MAKTEAMLNGFDEGIMLTQDGHVCEGSGENLFVVDNGALATPSASDSVLLGITRSTVMEIARNELDMPSVERQVDRSELYAADEVFLTGTAAHITPVIEIDHRAIGGRQGRPRDPATCQHLRGHNQGQEREVWNMVHACLRKLTATSKDKEKARG